jgi:putative transposase
MHAVDQSAPALSTKATCVALGVARASLYRWRGKKRAPAPLPAPRPAPPRALGSEERHQVLEVLHSKRFVDQPPHQVYATLLDEGRYLCSIRTMYRILDAHGEVKERRNQLRHPAYHKPELLATGPNEVWSWDITKLKGPAKWSHYCLYVILDIFSRYVVGWMVASRESASLAHRLIRDTCTKQGIEREALTLHADRGSSMRSKTVALLLADLGITKTHSRPYTSTDNPYSEAQFKTLKYRPEFPERFGCLMDARAFCRPFFHWYNTEHHHSGLALLTPEVVHYGRVEGVIEARQRVLQDAYEAHPERFVHKPPIPLRPPNAVWINSPKQLAESDEERH